MAYPGTFWFATTTIPLWSLLQIAFIETIYGQMDSFLGYSRYENYVMFGTYKIVQSLAVTLFMVQLEDLTERIRGGEILSLDMILLKPVDSQIMATLGRIWYGSFGALLVGVAMVLYGLGHEPHLVTLSSVAMYLAAIILATILLYILYFFIQTWLFWFEYLQGGETLWFTLQDVGQYPRNLYKGGLGVLLNIVVPVTMVASLPLDLLIGRESVWVLTGLGLVVAILFYLSRLFWQYSIKKYSSFSS
jgi:ABC-2 type transport system permease protein